MDKNHEVKIIRSIKEDGKNTILLFVDGEECDKFTFGQKLCQVDSWNGTIFDKMPTLVWGDQLKKFDWGNTVDLVTGKLEEIRDDIMRRIHEIQTWRSSLLKYEEVIFTA